VTIEHALALLILPLAVYAWVSASILVRAARIRPHIAVLTERAIVAVGIAVFGTIYAIVVINAEMGLWLDIDASVVAVRLGVVVLLSLPAYWSWAYATGRLGR
jgi:hypothetical protein